MKAQVVSDLHLEFGEVLGDVEKLIPVKSEILILPGDIGILGRSDYVEFFQWASKNFKYVLYVAGNHEFYHHEYYSVLKKMKEELSKFKNVHLLYRDSIIIEGIRFMGTSLWTKPPNLSRAKAVEMMYNDYRYIKIKEDNCEIRNLKMDDTTKFHEDDMKWMESEFEKARKNKEVCYLITHHVPLLGTKFLLPDEKRRDMRNCWYGSCTDESEFILKNMDVLKAIFFGHTHLSIVCSFGKSDVLVRNKEETTENEKEEKDKEKEEEEERIWLISNQVGYKHDRKPSKYKKNLVFEFPLESIKKVVSEIDDEDTEIWGEDNEPARKEEEEVCLVM